MRFHPGFTLAEVLIALAMLGVIAAFSVPKILQTVENQHKKLVFRETLALVEQLAIEGAYYKEPRLDATANNTLSDYLINKLNALKVCPNNYVTENCYPGDVTGISVDNDPAASIELASGAILIDLDKVGHFNNTTSSCQQPAKLRCMEIFAIDYNGTRPPNKEGVDAMRVVVGFGIPGTWVTTFGEGFEVTTGKIFPQPDHPKSVVLFNEVMQP